jgi:phage host-nuclease inhibitor protein Gam
MARKKATNYFPINTIQEADDALKEIAGLKREIELIEADMNEKIDQAKAEAEAQSAEPRSRLTMLEHGLQLFSAEKKSDLFDKKRTLELNFGRMGFRKSNELKTKKKVTWAKVLGALKEKGLLEAIRKKESVDKEILRQWSPEKLSEIGVEIQNKDTWWYEVDHQEIETV